MIHHRSAPRIAGLAGAGLLAFVLSACASTGSTAPPKQAASTADNPVGNAVQQPFKDLNLVRQELPPVLQSAQAAPYEHASLIDCGAVLAQISQLDAVLGLDVDDKSASGAQSDAGLFTDLLQGVIGLPFRGIIRRVTGAREEEQARLEAVLAGEARRAYLKGVAAERKCSVPR